MSTYENIFTAAQKGTIEDVKYFLKKKGSDINAKGHNGFTPLHYAAVGGNAEITKFLVSKGADVNAESKGGSTPLAAAAQGGNIEVAKLLIAKGANVNAGRKSGRSTPLHYAAYSGHAEFTKFLVSAGADVKAKNEQGITALKMAKDHGKTKIAKILTSAMTESTIQNDNGGEKTMSTHESIFTAAQKGTIEDVKYFLEEKGTDVNTRGPHDFTPLHAAALGRNLETAQFLISKGADIHAIDKAGLAPLTAAAFVNNVELAKILISKGADVNVRAPNGSTPLHAAAEEGNIEVAKLLISKGADINAKNNKGGTVLQLAEFRGKTEFVKTFTSAGGSELSEIEAAVKKCEKEISDGTLSADNWRKQTKNLCIKIFGKNTPDPTNTAKSQEYANGIKEAQSNLFERSNALRLASLTRQHPNDSQIRELGTRAAKCYLKLSEMILTVAHSEMTDDFKAMMKIPSIGEQLNGVKNMLSTAGLRIE